MDEIRETPDRIIIGFNVGATKLPLQKKSDGECYLEIVLKFDGICRVNERSIFLTRGNSDVSFTNIICQPRCILSLKVCRNERRQRIGTNEVATSEPCSELCFLLKLGRQIGKIIRNTHGRAQHRYPLRTRLPNRHSFPRDFASYKMRREAGLHSRDCAANRFVSPGRRKLFSLRYASHVRTYVQAHVRV